MIKRLIEFLLFGVLWELFKLTLSQFASFANSFITWLTLIGWIFIILLIAVLQWYNTKKGTGIFAFQITGKILSLFHINNPNLFFELKETALKKEIAVLLDDRPFIPSKDRSSLSKEEIEKREPLFSEIVKKISLYPSPDPRYMVISEIPKDHPLFSNAENYLNKALGQLFKDSHFINAYKIRPTYESYEQDWGCMVIKSGDPFDSIVTGKKHWVLFKN